MKREHSLRRNIYCIINYFAFYNFSFKLTIPVRIDKVNDQNQWLSIKIVIYYPIRIRSETRSGSLKISYFVRMNARINMQS